MTADEAMTVAVMGRAAAVGVVVEALDALYVRVRELERAPTWPDELVRALREVAEAAKGASCDSRSGLNCDDDSCANRVLPGPLDRLIAIEKKFEVNDKPQENPK